jgi:hypothetical protein
MRLLTNATAAEISAALESAGIDARVLTTEEETESQHARQEEYMSHGDPELTPGEADFFGNSEFDYNPGVQYNDAGEPRGFC